MSQDEIVAINYAISDATSILTPEQQLIESKRIEDQRALAVRNLHRIAARYAYTDEARDEVLQALGLQDYDVDRVFACGHPQTPENSTPDSRPGTVRCRQCQNAARAERTYPRRKAGAA